jgi:hypothetical protein
MITAGAEGVSVSDTPSLPAAVSAMVDDARAAERLGDGRRVREREEAAIRRLPHSRHQAERGVLHWRQRHEPEVSRESSRAYRLFSQLPVDLARLKRGGSA